MCYIRESQSKNIKLLEKLFKIIKLRNFQIENEIKTEIIIPKINIDISKKNNKIKNYINRIRKEKIEKKLIKKLIKLDIKQVILSKELKKNKELTNKIYSLNIDILNGKNLFEYLTLDTIKYVIKKRNLTENECHISILINDLNEIAKENILRIVQKYKKVNIISNHTKRFQEFQEEILEKYGIMIIVSNNKKRGMIKSNIVVNYDFPKEYINLYNIHEEAVIINIHENIDIINKRFNGFNIKNYEVIKRNKEGEKEEDKKENQKIKKIYDIKDYYEDKLNVRLNTNTTKQYKIFEIIEKEIEIIKVIRKS